MRTVTLGTWLVATVLFCSPSLMAGETDAIPQRLHARIGGFNGFTYEVQIQDGHLEYARSGGGQKSTRARVRPTLEQWKEFRRDLDAIGIWRWRKEYSTPGVVDGTQWLLDVAYSDLAIKTQGNNNYPGAAPDPVAVPTGSKVFTKYLKAVQQLLGGRAFE